MFKVKFEERNKALVMQALGIVEGEPYDIVLCQSADDMEDGKVNLVFEIAQLPQMTNQIQFLAQVQKTKLTGKTSKGEVKVAIDDILYVESFGNDIYAYTKLETLSLPYKLYQLSEQLEPFGFIRIGKSMIVNIACVYAIKPHFNGKLSLTLTNDQVLEVNRTYVPMLKQYLQK